MVTPILCLDMSYEMQQLRVFQKMVDKGALMSSDG